MSDINSNQSSISMGLDAIFSASDNKKFSTKKNNSNQINYVKISEINPSPFQARKSFSQAKLMELASSIKLNGILQPLIVRKINNKLELIAGERRLRAAKQLGITKVPVIECDIDNATAMASGIIENVQREDLNPMEEADAFDRLISEFGLSHDEIAKRIGKSRSHITNILRLRQLTDFVKNHVSSGKISMGHAKVLLTLTSDDQISVCNLIIEKEMSVRETEEYKRHILDNKLTKKDIVKNFIIDERQRQNLENWRSKLKALFNANVKLSFNKQGKGHIKLSVRSFEDMEALIRQMLNINKLT